MSTTARIATLSIPDDVRLVVPDGLHLITPYVLFEQHDWFEDEIKFLRRALRPGETVIDIGANYGVYAFSMARSVGPEGAVFAFEPAASTASYLQQGIDANGFTQIVLDRSALSDAPGTARLATSEHAELNALDHGQPSDGQAGEWVRVATLDEVMKRHAWAGVDCIKIDAEGEERRIIDGGREFFARYSPLVMYEVKAGTALNLDLAQAFASIGYKSYRLVPGLGALVPFESARQADDFVLNLFCCKPDRANVLARRGLLVDAGTAGEVTPLADPIPFISNLPYGTRLARQWAAAPRTPFRLKADRALAEYLASQESARSAADRYQLLRSALSSISAVCDEQPTFTRRASLARISAAAGERSFAVSTLSQVQHAYASGRAMPELGEPFLPPTERFDRIEPGEDVHAWMHAAVLESVETLCAFSSYFTGPEALARLEMLVSLGFANAEMQRRLQLVRLKFPNAAKS